MLQWKPARVRRCLALLATARVSGTAEPAGRRMAPRRRRRWPEYIRYSPLDQINANNVKNLKIAWIWRGDNFGSQPEYKNETTPLMVDGVLYFTAGDRRSVVAADPGTGETLWVWRIDEGARADGVRKNSRGVAYWTDGQQSRIFTVTPGYQLVALDAKTGHPIASFGKDGIVDLTKEVEKDANFNPAVGHLMNTSPPLVSGNIVVIPTSLENGRVPKSQKYPKGDIMAFDARTGKKRLGVPHHSAARRIRRRHLGKQFQCVLGTRRRMGAVLGG